MNENFINQTAKDYSLDYATVKNLAEKCKNDFEGFYAEMEYLLTVGQPKEKQLYANDGVTKMIDVTITMLIVESYKEWAILQSHDDPSMEAYIYNLETKEVYNSYLDFTCQAISQDWLELTGKKLYYNIIY